MTAQRTLSHAEARSVYNQIGGFQDTQAVYEDGATNALFAHSDFESARSVFELGVGTGRLAKRLLEEHLGPQVTYRGVDVSTRMIELASKRLAKFGDRVEVTLSDGTIQYDVADQSIDRFFSSYVIDLLSDEDIDRVFAEAHRMLAPGGKLCCASMTGGQTTPQRLVTGILEKIHALEPRLIGGCRPVAIAPRLDPKLWRIERAETLSKFGVCSEIVVAEVIR